MLTSEDRKRIEIDYWRDSPEERPGPLTVANILNKMRDAQHLWQFLRTYEALFRGRVLELGAGQAWAACLVKKLFPDTAVIATDISPYAIAAVPEWEKLWGVRLERAYACEASSTLEEPGSVDLAFCFAAAHHFTDRPAVFNELRRILKPEGRALFLYEPTTPAYLYPLAKWRVNRIRPQVPEDVLVRSELEDMARQASLEIRFDDCYISEGRRPTAALYYRTLQILPPLRRLLPCSAHILVRKRS